MDDTETLSEVVLDGNNGEEDIMVEVFVGGLHNHDSVVDDTTKSVTLPQDARNSGNSIFKDVVGVVDAERAVEEDLIVEDTQLLDDATQPLLEEAAGKIEAEEGLKNPLVEKGAQEDCVEDKIRANNLDGKDKLNSAGVEETGTSDLLQVSEEKLSAVENVSGKGEAAKTGMPVTDTVSANEPVSVAVQVRAETTTIAEDQNLEGESKGVSALVADDAEMVDMEHTDSEPLEPVDCKTGDAKMIDSDVGQELKTGQEVVPDAEKVPADVDANAVLEEPLNVETVVADGVTEADVDTEMAELQEADVYEFDEENMKQAGAPEIGVQARYQLPPEKDNAGEFAVSDLVWGKVRSHPWWPGQIFDPSDASEEAVNHQKKDAFLVAYFGDRTFGWNESNLLKPFRSHFSAVEKQGSSEAFQNAVECALEEVSRRVEIGLACACTPKEALESKEFQSVENTGIKEESTKREGAGEYSKCNLFEPDKLMDYLKDLAKVPNGGAGRLELVIAKAQLLSFYRLKGYSFLPEMIFTDGFSENAVYSKEENRITAEITGSMSAEEEDDSSGQEGMPRKRSTLKRKHNLRECTYPYKKEKLHSTSQ